MAANDNSETANGYLVVANSSSEAVNNNSGAAGKNSEDANSNLMKSNLLPTATGARFGSYCQSNINGYNEEPVSESSLRVSIRNPTALPQSCSKIRTLGGYVPTGGIQVFPQTLKKCSSTLPTGVSLIPMDQSSNPVFETNVRSPVGPVSRSSTSGRRMPPAVRKKSSLITKPLTLPPKPPVTEDSKLEDDPESSVSLSAVNGDNKLQPNLSDVLKITADLAEPVNDESYKFLADTYVAGTISSPMSAATIKKVKEISNVNCERNLSTSADVSFNTASALRETSDCGSRTTSSSNSETTDVTPEIVLRTIKSNRKQLSIVSFTTEDLDIFQS